MGKKKLIGLLLAVVLLYGLGSSMYHHNILDSVNRNFQISLPGFYQKYIYGVSAREGEREEGYNAFACRDADAVHYSVWRFFDQEALLQALNWQQNGPIRQDVIEAVQQIACVDERYLLQNAEGAIYTFYIENQYSFSWKGKLLLVFVPQATLQNGKNYENVLFLYEWDSQFF